MLFGNDNGNDKSAHIMIMYNDDGNDANDESAHIMRMMCIVQTQSGVQ